MTRFNKLLLLRVAVNIVAAIALFIITALAVRAFTHGAR